MTKEKPDTSLYSAPALEKGLDILELLADSPAGLTQNQIAAQLGRSASELFRMVEVLERRSYVGRIAQSSAYQLTLKMFELAHRQPPVKRLLETALPRMQALAKYPAYRLAFGARPPAQGWRTVEWHVIGAAK